MNPANMPKRKYAGQIKILIFMMWLAVKAREDMNKPGAAPYFEDSLFSNRPRKIISSRKVAKNTNAMNK